MANAVILIDDIRLFQHMETYPDTALEGYPTFHELCIALRKIDSSYVCYIIGDTAIAYSRSQYDIAPSELIQGCTASRSYPQELLKCDDILKMEQYISQASEHEQNMLLYFIANFYEYGSGCYHLWRGLIAESRSEYAQALISYKLAYKNGIQDWRPLFYVARCNFKTKNYEDAIIILKQIINDHPSSAEINSLYMHCELAIRKSNGKSETISYDNCEMKNVVF